MKPFDPMLRLVADQAGVRATVVYFIWHAMKSEGQRFNRDVLAAFASIQRHYVDSVIAALEEHNALPTEKSPIQSKRGQSTPRGSQLQADWRPPEEFIAFAVNERHWSRKDAIAEAERMRDWAIGKGEAKKDWLATWRNWVRGSSRPNGQAPRESSMSRAEQLRMQIATYRKIGRDIAADELQNELDQIEANVVPFRREA